MLKWVKDRKEWEIRIVGERLEKIELKEISGHLLSYRGKMNILKVMNTIAMGSNLL